MKLPANFFLPTTRDEVLAAQEEERVMLTLWRNHLQGLNPKEARRREWLRFRLVFWEVMATIAVIVMIVLGGFVK